VSKKHDKHYEKKHAVPGQHSMQLPQVRIDIRLRFEYNTAYKKVEGTHALALFVQELSRNK